MPAEPMPSTEARRASVLVIDDEPLVAAGIADTLMVIGYEVETAKNGREALEKIATCSYDLILSDLRMPDLDGMDLYRELERHAPRLLQRLIFLSETTDSAEYMRFLEGTGALVLCKPFDIDTLQRLVRQLLLDQDTPRPANGVSPSSPLSHADKSMLNAAAEQKRQSVGINPPHQRPDAERRPLGGN